MTNRKIINLKKDSSVNEKSVQDSSGKDKSEKDYYKKENQKKGQGWKLVVRKGQF